MTSPRPEERGLRGKSLVNMSTATAGGSVAGMLLVEFERQAAFGFATLRERRCGCCSRGLRSASPALWAGSWVLWTVSSCYGLMLLCCSKEPQKSTSALFAATAWRNSASSLRAHACSTSGGDDGFAATE